MQLSKFLPAFAFSATAYAQNPFTFPGDIGTIRAGSPFNITWAPSPATVSVTLVLRQSLGDVNNLATIVTIAANLPNNGCYTWTPDAALPKGSGYAFQIVDDANEDLTTYSSQFTLDTPTTHGYPINEVLPSPPAHPAATPEPTPAPLHPYGEAPPTKPYKEAPPAKPYGEVPPANTETKPYAAPQVTPEVTPEVAPNPVPEGYPQVTPEVTPGVKPTPQLDYTPGYPVLPTTTAGPRLNRTTTAGTPLATATGAAAGLSVGKAGVLALGLGGLVVLL
ncbi:hypothetical protein HYALB_00006160 [Hymenoscyphus albidus]|uniref:Yeast cell wall synthesis Kre9/Knh1-like N-terminal domain-containing protein n=1 Tax=Hymenoscyphus albidus TaxID=595503 RepID=A0A9N9LPU0_9HELO|nr:hypothetical protein HYALB_00006160 [Hymenoscyphus albidus]